MSLSPFRLIKQLLFTPAYVRLYPLSQKEGIVEKINTYNYDAQDTFTEDISSLYEYLQSDLASDKIDKGVYDRGLDSLYKTRKIKYKDKETQKKIIERVKFEKGGTYNKHSRENFNNKIKTLNERSSTTQSLIDRLTNGTITQEDLPKLDAVLKKNRFRATTYIAAISLIVIIVAVILIFFK